jgi:NADPH-dependent ferric siderophore reductase
MTLLVGETRIRLSDPALRLAQLCEHLTGHNAQLTEQEGESRLAFAIGTATLRAEPGLLALRAETAGLDEMALLKNTLIGHLEAFVGNEPLDVVWTGDGAGPRPLPNFRALRVARAEWVTPQMRRLTFSGENLARYDARELHVKLLIPPPGAQLAEPSLGVSGRPVWPADLPRPLGRTYTIRGVDAAAGLVDVDFVAHGDAGPGTRLALTAQPGDVVGMMGPGGGSARPAGWTLFAGDETALPAIGRMLERMPADARGLALIEIADRAEEQDLPHPAGVELRWLHRNGIEAGRSALLREAALAAAPPAGEADVFAWAGCEFATFRALRAHWRDAWGLDKTRHLAVAYWRHGLAEDVMRAG